MLVNDIKTYREEIEKFSKCGTVIVDTETTGLNPFKDDHIVGVSLGTPIIEDSVYSVYIPFRHQKGTNIPLELIPELNKVFSGNKKVLGWNLKFDNHFLRRDGVDIGTQLYDVMLAAHLSNENNAPFALKTHAAKYFGKEAVTADEELKRLLRGRKEGIGELDPSLVSDYAEADVALPWKLFRRYKAVLEKDDVYNLFMEICEYSKIVTNIEQRGVLVDFNECGKGIKLCMEKLTELRANIDKILGIHINLNSPQQICRALGLKSSEKTVLEKSSLPVAQMILDHRHWHKLLNTFYTAAVDMADPSFRVHPNFNIHGTVTGRLSCKSPNMQAFPREGEYSHVRGVIVAPEGYSLIAADIDQAELRMLAHYSQDVTLLDAYRTGKDIHQEAANKLGIDRFSAKTLNFAIIYGAGSYKIAKLLGISLEKAEEVLARYAKVFPGVKALSYKICETAEIYGRIRMWSGRLRRFQYKSECYKALNSLIQGGVAEIVRTATMRLHPLLPEDVHIVLQIHDELLLECPDSKVDQIVPILKQVMQDWSFRIPIKVDVKVGKSWGQMVKLS